MKISLNELRTLVREIIMEEDQRSILQKFKDNTINKISDKLTPWKGGANVADKGQENKSRMHNIRQMQMLTKIQKMYPEIQGEYKIFIDINSIDNAIKDIQDSL